MNLRPYQLDAIERVKTAIRRLARQETSKAVLAVSPTGSGKTVMFSHVIESAAKKERPSIVFAHRRELINQTYEKVIAAGVDSSRVGVIMASDKARRNPGALVQIASIDTFRNRQPPPADLVIIDEAHRSMSPSYLKLREQYPQAVFLGFTATPWRGDGRGLGGFYNELIVVANVRELIEQGYLVRTRVYSHPEKPDLSEVKMKGDDYDPHALAKVVDTAVLIGNIVEHWQAVASGARTIVFAASVEHSKHIVEAFVQAGVAAEHLDGTTPAADRDAILARLRSGDTQVVSNCAVLTEGFDCPAVKCVVLARPTKSKSLYFQCVGRAMRPVPGTTGDQHAIVLDHAGCAWEHGLPTDPQDYSLECAKRTRGPREMSVTTCPGCYAVLEAGTEVCPYCGAELPKREASQLQEKDGQLQEIIDTEERRKKLEEARISKLRKRIQRFCYSSDYRRGWESGETNKRLFAVFGKSRTKMSIDELKSVEVFISERFDDLYPPPAPKSQVSPGLIEASVSMPTGDDEVIEWVA